MDTLSPAVEQRLQELLQRRHFVLSEAVSDERVRRFISQLSEAHALQGLSEFENAVQSQKEIRNPAGYLVGVFKRVVANSGGGLPGHDRRPMGELTPRVHMAIDALVRRGIIGPRDIDERCMEQMKDLTEAEALSSLEELWHIDRSQLKNPSAYLTVSFRKHLPQSVGAPPTAHYHSAHSGPPRQDPRRVRAEYSTMAPPPATQSRFGPPPPMDYASYPPQLRYNPAEEIEYIPSSQVQPAPALQRGPSPLPAPGIRRRLFAQHGLPPSVEEMLERIVELSGVSPEEIEPRVLAGLRDLGEHDALSALKECMIADPKSIRNISAYLVGIIRRLQRGSDVRGPVGMPAPPMAGPPAYHHHPHSHVTDPRHRGREPYDYDPSFPAKRMRGSPMYDEFPPPAGPVHHGAGGYDRPRGPSPDRGYPPPSVDEEFRNMEAINMEVARLVHAGRFRESDIPLQLRQHLAQHPLRIALQALTDLSAKDLSKIKNIVAYTKGIMRKISEREAESRAMQY